MSEVNGAARALLEGAFRPLWVGGEVANWRRHGSGHCYFSLRDADAQLACVMFRSSADRLPTHPEEGMEVCALGQLTIYEVRGSYQLVVRELVGKGEGLWRLAFERIRAKLAAEGLLDPARKRPLPRVPACVGVVTSRSGAALQDVAAVLRRRAPWTRILLSDCRVQGADAAPEIVAALQRLGRHGAPEVVIVTRGGGSVEDLWAFNDERVARAIADCPVPVVSAVGHEIDFTIADLVADRRAATPSAAAETVVPEAETLKAELRDLAGGLVGGLRTRARLGAESVRQAWDRLVHRIEASLAERGDRVAVAGGRLNDLSPLATLRRGYAVPLSDDRHVLRHRAMFRIGDGFRLRIVDGIVGCHVDSVEPLQDGSDRDG